MIWEEKISGYYDDRDSPACGGRRAWAGSGESAGWILKRSWIVDRGFGRGKRGILLNQKSTIGVHQSSMKLSEVESLLAQQGEWIDE